MHGLGNDFVVLDARTQPLTLSEAQVRRISDRNRGVGCDQFIIIRPAKNPAADAFMEIRNCDGNEVEACGNATRCIAKLLTAETGKPQVTIETVAGLLLGQTSPQGFSVDMGLPAPIGRKSRSPVSAIRCTCRWTGRMCRRQSRPISATRTPLSS